MSNKGSIVDRELYIHSISYVADSVEHLDGVSSTLNIYRNLDLLVYIVEGYAEYCFDGSSHTLRAGDVVYLANGCTYDRHIKSDYYHFICVEFSFDISEKNMISQVFSSVQGIDSVFKKLHKTWTVRGMSFRTKSMSILYDIYSKLLWNEFNTYIPVQKREVFRDIIKKISENYADSELSVHLLAQEANMSDVHFRKIFKTIYKVSPQQYIIALRIDRAKELLTFEDISVLDISEALGFSDSCHFSRIFKQKTGYTPLEYRRIYNKQ